MTDQPAGAGTVPASKFSINGAHVGVAVGVAVAVAVGVFVGVLVGVFVGVLVGVFVGVAVGVAVGVFVGVPPGHPVTMDTLSTTKLAIPVSTCEYSKNSTCEPPLAKELTSNERKV